jgi:hypothetical protein
MIRKQSDNINFDALLGSDTKKVDYRKELAERQPEMKRAKKAEKDRSWAEQKIQKEAYGDPIARGRSSVRPSRCASEGGITDMGGSKKQVGCETNNSIWNNEVLSKMANDPSSRELTASKKESADRIRQKKQAEYKQSMSPQLGAEADELAKKASSVNPVSAKSSGKGWVPANKISMFDTNTNFDRLTALENRVNPKVEKTAEQKIPMKKIASSKDMTNRFVDGVIDQGRDSSYKSVHNDAVSRLFKVLSERNSKEA